MWKKIAAINLIKTRFFFWIYIEKIHLKTKLPENIKGAFTQYSGKTDWSFWLYGFKNW